MNKRNGIIAVVLALVVAGMVYQFHHSPEWRNFSLSALWEATRGARWGLIVAALALAYSSYLLRALRWRTLMIPSGQLWPVLKGTVIGFTGVALLGRPGELIRPYYIARKHGSTLSPQLAVWLLERALDMSASVLLVGIALALNQNMQGSTSHLARQAGLVLSLAVLVLIVLLVLFQRFSGPIIEACHRRWAHAEGGTHRVEHFLRALATGMEPLRRPRCLLLAIFYTLIMWVGITASLWFVVVAIPQTLPQFTYAQALLLLGFTLVGSLFQLPGVGGGVQATTIFGLTAVFDAPIVGATSAALLIWLISFYAIAPVGAYFATREGIRWQAVEQEAEVSERVEEETELKAELAAESGTPPPA